MHAEGKQKLYAHLAGKHTHQHRAHTANICLDVCCHLQLAIKQIVCSMGRGVVTTWQVHSDLPNDAANGHCRAQCVIGCGEQTKPIMSGMLQPLLTCVHNALTANPHLENGCTRHVTSSVCGDLTTLANLQHHGTATAQHDNMAEQSVNERDNSAMQNVPGAKVLHMLQQASAYIQHTPTPAIPETPSMRKVQQDPSGKALQ